jgi:hypothetical protein
MKRIVGAVLIAALGLATLTACDPPYPPELVETIYEQNPVCEAGVVPVKALGRTEQLVSTFNDTMVGLCPDMSVELNNENPELTITLDDPSTIDGVYAATPLFVDGGVAVTSFSSGVTLTLSLPVLFKILSGEITTWNDPQIIKLNKKIDPIDLPIVVNPVADRKALEALENWAKLTKVAVPATLLTTGEDSPTIDLLSVEEGTISILPLSDVLNQGASPSSIKAGKVVAPTDTSVFAGASQFKATNKGAILHLVQDPTIEPELAKGAETADTPYQAVFFGWQVLAGTDNLKTRAVGRFLLRMDEQGTLPGASLIGLPTKLRQASTALVSKGLKLPKVTIKK